MSSLVKSKSQNPSAALRQREYRSSSQTAQDINHLAAKLSPQKTAAEANGNLRIGLKRISATDVVSVGKSIVNFWAPKSAD